MGNCTNNKNQSIELNGLIKYHNTLSGIYYQTKSSFFCYKYLIAFKSKNIKSNWNASYLIKTRFNHFRMLIIDISKIVTTKSESQYFRFEKFYNITDAYSKRYKNAPSQTEIKKRYEDFTQLFEGELRFIKTVRDELYAHYDKGKGWSIDFNIVTEGESINWTKMLNSIEDILKGNACWLVEESKRQDPNAEVISVTSSYDGSFFIDFNRVDILDKLAN